MPNRFFANWGQVAQATFALLACLFAGIKAWPDMKSSNLLTLGALIFYLLIGTVIATFVVLFRRSQFAGTPRGSSDAADEDYPIKMFDPVFTYAEWDGRGHKLTFPLKCTIQMRNDSQQALDVSLADFTPTTVTLKQFVATVLQVQFGSFRCPDEPVERIAVFPGQQFRLWLAVDETKFNETQLKQLPRGQTGTLALRVSGRLQRFPV
jgi:hypothetical protein